jgi:thiol:disulfide interchange protein DsbD
MPIKTSIYLKFIVQAWLLFFVFAGASLVHAATLLPAEKAFKPNISRSKTAISIQFDIADGYYLYRDRTRLAANLFINHKGISFSPAQQKEDKFLGKQAVYYRTATVTLPLTNPANEAEFDFTLTIQGCAEVGVCYVPKTLKLVAPALNAKKNQWLPWSSTAPAPEGLLQNHPSSDSSWLTQLALFFVAGLALAFTACLYPLLPIISSIISQKMGAPAPTKWQALVLAFSYTQGLAVAYTIIGVAAGLSGNLITVQLQQAPVILLASVLMVILSLSLFDVYQLQLPVAWQSAINRLTQHTRGGEWLGVFVMGAASALIIGPCVSAPLVSILTYIGSTKDALFGGLALYVLALGLGFPLLIFATVGAKLLPKKGAWMNAIKTLMGTVMMALAVYLAWPFLQNATRFSTISCMSLLAFVLFSRFSALPVAFRHAMRFSALAVMVYATITAFGYYSDSSKISVTTAASSALGAGAVQKSAHFETYTDSDALKQALQQAQSNGQTVLLDFYADWCVSCHEMEAETLSNPQVIAAIKPLRRLQFDVTQGTQAQQDFLRDYGLFGPPALILIAPNGQERWRMIGLETAPDFLKRFP